MSVFSEKGDLIYTRDQNVEQGSRKIHIDLTNQITGTYIVTLRAKLSDKALKLLENNNVKSTVLSFLMIFNFSKSNSQDISVTVDPSYERYQTIDGFGGGLKEERILLLV